MAESYNVEARLSVDDSGFSSKLKSAAGSLDGLDKKTSSSSGSMIKFGAIFGAAAKVAGTAVAAIGRGLSGMNSDIQQNIKTWSTFSGTMKSFGKSSAEINKVKKSLQSYAEATIYSSADMASTYSQLTAVGVKGADTLVKGFAGLAAAADNPKQAMKSLSQQATQMAAKPKVAWEDFKIMLEQSPAGMAKVAQAMGISLEQLIGKVQDGTLKTQDFFAAVDKGGNSKGLQNMATQYRTVDEAIDGVKENIVNQLTPVMEQMGKRAIPVIVAIGDKLAEIDFQGIANKLMSVTDKIYSALKKVFDYVSKNKDWLGPLTIGLATFVGTLTGLVKAITIFQQVKSKIDTIKNAVTGAKSAFQLLNSALGISPWMLLVAAIAAVVAGLVWFFTQTKTGREIVAKVVKAMQEAWQNFADFMSDLWDNIVEIASGVWDKITDAWSTAVEAAKNIWDGISDKVQGVVDVIKDIWSGIVDFFSEIWQQITETASGVWDGIVEEMAPIVESIKGVWDALVEFFQTLWELITTTAKTTWTGFSEFMAPIVEGIKTLWNGLVEFFQIIWNGVISAAQVAWSMLSTVIQAAWDVVTGIIQMEIDIMVGIFQAGWALLAPIVQAVWTVISGVVSTAWEVIKTIISTAINIVVSIIQTQLQIIVTVWQTAWNVLSTVLKAVWDIIKTVIVTTLDVIKGLIKTATAIIKGDWQGAWEQIKGIAQTIWNGIKSVITTAINAVKSVINSVMNGIKSVVTSIWNSIKSVTSSVWNGIKSVVDSVVNGIKSVISGLSSVVSGVRSTFNSVKDAIVGPIKSAYDTVKNIIGGIGNAIGSIGNKIGGLLGLRSVSISTDDENQNPFRSASYDEGSAFRAAGTGFMGLFAGLSDTAKNLTSNATNPMSSFRSRISNGFSSMNSDSLAGQLQMAGQPATINLALGRNDYAVFVDDISNNQDRTAQLVRKYSL